MEKTVLPITATHPILNEKEECGCGWLLSVANVAIDQIIIWIPGAGVINLCIKNEMSNVRIQVQHQAHVRTNTKQPSHCSLHNTNS